MATVAENLVAVYEYFEQIKKEEEHPEWTVLTAVTDKDGKTPSGRVYIPPTLGYDSEAFAKLKKDELTEIVENLTITPGLKIPHVPVTREPNLRSRMYREKYPDLEQNVVVLVKRIDVMGVYVSLLEYDETEGMILLSELSRRRIRSVKKLVSSADPRRPCRMGSLRRRSTSAGKRSPSSCAWTRRRATSTSPSAGFPPRT